MKSFCTWCDVGPLQAIGDYVIMEEVTKWCALKLLDRLKCESEVKQWKSKEFRESTGTPSPKVGVALGVWGFIPSHFPTLLRTCGVTPKLPLGPQPCKPLCFSREPKARVATQFFFFMHDVTLTPCKWLRIM
jgi:hypothetical protein